MSPSSILIIISACSEEEAKKSIPPVMEGWTRKELSVEEYPPQACYQWRVQIRDMKGK
jgi:hypothetical protein